MGRVRCPPLKGALDRSKKRGLCQAIGGEIHGQNPWGKSMRIIIIITIQGVQFLRDVRGFRGSRLVCLPSVLRRFAAFAPLLVRLAPVKSGGSLEKRDLKR